MSKPRLRIYAVVDTEAHADSIISSISNRLSGKDVFDELSFGRFTDKAGTVKITAEFRFNNSVDRDDVRGWVKDQISNHPQVKTWIAKASVTSHLCTHDDEEVKDCSTTEFVRWEK